MGRDKAYREAEKKIEEARQAGATRLDLSAMNLTELPESLGQLTQLQTLDLAGNQLTALPQSLGQLTRLRILNLGGLGLTSVPSLLKQLKELEELHLWENSLAELPSWLGEFRRLRKLHASENELAEVPASLGQLKELRELFLYENTFSDFPASFASLELTTLELRDTPLNPELAAAYEQGLDAVKAYFRAKAKDQIVLNEAKLILIGRGKWGKPVCSVRCGGMTGLRNVPPLAALRLLSSRLC